MVRKGCLVMALGLSLSLALSGARSVLADDEGSSSGSSSGGSDSSSSSSTGGDSPPPYNTLLDVGGSKDSGSGGGKESGGGGKESSGAAAAAAPAAAPAAEGSDSGAPKADPVKDPAPNALGGLFVPQPQYPSPNKTIMNPDTVPSHLGSDGSQPGRNPGQPGAVYDPGHSSAVQGTENKDNPLKGLFQMQPQYPSPGKTIMFPEAVPKNLGDDGSVQGRNPGQAGAVYQGEDPNKFAEPSGNKDNVIKGLFQMQPQYPSPGKTVMFPEPVPAHLGGTAGQAGSQPGQAPAVFSPPRFEEVEQKFIEAAAASSGNPLEKVETEKGKEGVKDKDGKEVKEGKDKDKEGKEKDKEGKDKDGKDKEGKDKEKGKEDDKDKEGQDKEKDEADKDKDKEKSAEEKDKEGAAEKSEDKDKSKEEGKDKEGKDKEGKDKEGKDGKSKDAKDKEKEKGKEKKDETKYEAYHPLREAILLMNTGKLQQSHDLLHKHLSQNPRDAQAYYTRAVLRVNMRNYAGAAEDYREVIKLVPTGDLSNLARTGLAKIHF